MREQRTCARSTQTARSASPTGRPSFPAGAWSGVLKRTLREYKADNLGDLAAA